MGLGPRGSIETVVKAESDRVEPDGGPVGGTEGRLRPSQVLVPRRVSGPFVSYRPVPTLGFFPNPTFPPPGRGESGVALDTVREGGMEV